MPQPNFSVDFVWCTTAKHTYLLQKWCSNIEIAICATNAGQTWTAGYAVIGIQHAQVSVSDVGLSLQRFPVYDVKTETQMVRQPELVVTLSIHLLSPHNIDSQLYSANLSESSSPRSPIDGFVTTKTKKEKRQERLNRLAQPHSITEKNFGPSERSLGVDSNSITSKMSGQSVNSLPSRIRWILQNIDPNKIASLGVYGSSSTFQMIGKPPPTRKPEFQIRKSLDHTPVTEAEEEEIEIQKSHDQTPAPSLQTILSKPHVKVKKSVRFIDDSDSVEFEENTTSANFEKDT